MDARLKAPNWPVLLGNLETRIDRLKSDYEKYFAGIERLEPYKERQAVGLVVRRYSTTPIQNTGHKFRLSSLVARYNSYQTYWDRMVKEIDEGRSRRDRFRQKNIIEVQEKETAKPKAASNDPMQLLYDQYVKLKVKNKESVAGLSPDKLAGVIKQQAGEIKKRFNVTKVSFKVVSEGGKTKIKAVPKK